jgi:PAS domain-containing protein
MIRIARQINLNAIFMASLCIGMFLLGVETSEGAPQGSLFLLPLCLAWIGRDPRAMKLAIVGALLLLVLVWAQAGFSLDHASLLQWCSSAFLIVFLGGCLLEAQQAVRSAEMSSAKTGGAEDAAPAPRRPDRPKRRLPKDRSLSATTLQGILDSIQGAAFLFDKDMRLILANDRAEEIIAFARPGAEVAHAAEFLPESALDLLYKDIEKPGKAREETVRIVGKAYRLRLQRAGKHPLLIVREPEPESDSAS